MKIGGNYLHLLPCALKCVLLTSNSMNSEKEQHTDVYTYCIWWSVVRIDCPLASHFSNVCPFLRGFIRLVYLWRMYAQFLWSSRTIIASFTSFVFVWLNKLLPSCVLAWGFFSTSISHLVLHHFSALALCARPACSMICNPSENLSKEKRNKQ